jgi:cobalt-zinc-cadmium efflux system outer membrane protein
MSRIRIWFTVTVLAPLAGCASMPAPQGVGAVRSLVDARTGSSVSWPAISETRAAIGQRVESLLAQPLSRESAVQIALLRNPRIQIEYARLGIAAADVLDASRLSNPGFSVSDLQPVSGNVASLVNAGLSQSFSDLLLLRARKRLAVGEYERAQLLIADSLMELAAGVRSAWYAYVGAEQIAAMRDKVATAAQASADLAGKFHDAGNLSELQLALNQAAATQARLAVARARAEVSRARAALSELLGLQANENRWTITARLATPVRQEDAPDRLLELARAQRLDWAAARREVTLLEESLSTTKRYRWIGSVDVGVAAERDPDTRAKLVGPTLSLQLPIFNQGQGAIARMQGRLDQKRGELDALGINIETGVMLGTERVQAAREIADAYRTELLPQRETVVARSQENLNYMLIGSFELLLAKQQQYDAYQGYLEAVRDYWLAREDLTRTVGARLPSESTVAEPTLSPDESPQSEPKPASPNGGGTP